MNIFGKGGTMSECKSCGCSDEESDLMPCAGCGNVFCDDCVYWCSDEDDEASGDYFCRGCSE